MSIQCMGCMRMYLKRDMSAHTALCTDSYRPCHHGCSAQVRSAEEAAHLEVCPMREFTRSRLAGIPLPRMPSLPSLNPRFPVLMYGSLVTPSSLPTTPLGVSSGLSPIPIRTPSPVLQIVQATAQSSESVYAGGILDCKSDVSRDDAALSLHKPLSPISSLGDDHEMDMSD